MFVYVIFYRTSHLCFKLFLSERRCMHYFSKYCSLSVFDWRAINIQNVLSAHLSTERKLRGDSHDVCPFS